MSAARRSWLTIGLAATLVLVVLATALAVTDRFTPRERGAIDALQPVADRPDDHIGQRNPRPAPQIAAAIISNSPAPLI